LLRSASKVSQTHILLATKAAPTESLPELQPGVVEAGSSDQQQQTLDAFVAEQPLDGGSTFSDMSVEDPPTFEELGVDKLLVVSMHAEQWAAHVHAHVCGCKVDARVDQHSTVSSVAVTASFVSGQRKQCLNSQVY
jgi:hypothetical protein